MLLPGTINLNLLQIQSDSVPDDNDPTFNTETLKNMTSLRALAVPIYMNGNYKRCDCDEGNSKEVNYVIHQPMAETIQLERYYNRLGLFLFFERFVFLDYALCLEQSSRDLYRYVKNL